MELLDAAVVRNLMRRTDGRAWISGLPALVNELRRRWDLGELGAPYPGGSHSLTAPVTLSHGARAVLKVPVVDDENRLEAEALRLYSGDGAVELLAFDASSGAMLLEEARPGRPLADHPDRFEAIDVICALLRRLRRPVPDGRGFTPVTNIARAWSRRLEARLSELPGETARHLAGEAAATAFELSRTPEVPLLVNRDAHLDNVLASHREAWLLIDPKPLIGDAAFDAGYLVNWLIGGERTPDHASRIVSRLAAGLDVTEARVCAWGLVRAMDNALWALLGVGDDPAPYVETAAALSAIG